MQNQNFTHGPYAFGQHHFLGACAEFWNTINMGQHKGRSTKISCRNSWTDKDVKELMQIMQETIIFSLNTAKTPKEKRAAYKNVQVKMQKRRKLKL